MDQNQEIIVCGSCLRASCWHGEFMCDEYRTSKVIKKTRRELDKLNLEHPSNYSDEKLAHIYG